MWIDLDYDFRFKHKNANSLTNNIDGLHLTLKESNLKFNHARGMFPLKIAFHKFLYDVLDKKTTIVKVVKLVPLDVISVPDFELR